MEAQELINTIARKEELKSQLNQILEAFQQMDYHKLNDLLAEGSYQDMPKTAFIYRQKRIFGFMQNRGDSHLKLSTNICTGCLCGKPVFVLRGNTTGLAYGIYVEFVNDAIVDVFICSEQSDILGMLSI